MSGFYGASINQTLCLGGPGHVQNNPVLQRGDYNENPSTLEGALRFSDYLWPRSSLTGQSDLANNPPIWESAHQAWEWELFPTGVHVRKKIEGQTLDAVGSPLPNATVQIFNTATGVLVDTQTSDSAGNYRASDPNAVPSFAVGYKSGAPDVAGTTKNNLTGT